MMITLQKVDILACASNIIILMVQRIFRSS